MRHGRIVYYQAPGWLQGRRSGQAIAGMPVLRTCPIQGTEPHGTGPPEPGCIRPSVHGPDSGATMVSQRKVTKASAFCTTMLQSGVRIEAPP